jgi:predicted solute-binding protein
MAAGDLDIALLPIIELARLPELEIVPGLSISSFGACESVLLFTRRPLSEVSRLAFDPESRTSNVLARLLLVEAWGANPECSVGTSDLERTLDTHDAAVRIGDKALFEAPPPGVEIHDLGAAWTTYTGLPFVYAAWAARPGVVDRELYDLLHASRREGTRAIDAIAAEYEWRGTPRPEIARHYLRDRIRHRLGAAEVSAIERFLSAVSAHGWIGHVPEVRLATDRVSGCHERAALADGPASERR